MCAACFSSASSGFLEQIIDYAVAFALRPLQRAACLVRKRRVSQLAFLPWIAVSVHFLRRSPMWASRRELIYTLRRWRFQLSIGLSRCWLSQGKSYVEIEMLRPLSPAVPPHGIFSFAPHINEKNQKCFLKDNITNNCLHVGCTT